MSVVLGVDLSLTSTGLAVVRTDDPLWSSLRTIKSKGARADGLVQRRDRLAGIVIAVLGLAQSVEADLVALEGPSFASQGASTHDRSGLWWLTTYALTQNGFRVVEIPPTCRIKYGTGKGNSSKDAVLAAVVRRYPHADVRGNDDADALILACMGARLLGEPVEASLPQANLEALKTLEIPK
jgi:crossover junction endodeoxyribonuclease RuvC